MYKIRIITEIKINVRTRNKYKNEDKECETRKSNFG